LVVGVGVGVAVGVGVGVGRNKSQILALVVTCLFVTAVVVVVFGVEDFGREFLALSEGSCNLTYWRDSPAAQRAA
jgi:hypothetical protein